MDLKTTYLGLELANPIVVGACPLGTSVDSIRSLEGAGAAAVVLPSLFEEEIMAAARSGDLSSSARQCFSTWRASFLSNRLIRSDGNRCRRPPQWRRPNGRRGGRLR